MELYPFAVQHPDEIGTSLAAAAKAKVDALLVFSDPVFFSARARIMTAAMEHRLPSVSEGKEFVEAGGLLSYSPSIPALARRAAVFIDKILKGARPGDVPIEQPAKFQLVVNLKTAKAMGLTIPASLLTRADQLIE
jgi:putative ABC transport system substrate-binding protein